MCGHSSVRVNGEFYVAPVYNEGVAEGHRYSIFNCDKVLHFLALWPLSQHKFSSYCLTLSPS